MEYLRGLAGPARDDSKKMMNPRKLISLDKVFASDEQHKHSYNSSDQQKQSFDSDQNSSDEDEEAKPKKKKGKKNMQM